MEEGQGQIWECSAKEKKKTRASEPRFGFEILTAVTMKRGVSLN
jgi:hypothetical protein